MGALPAGLVNSTTIPGHPGNYEVGTTESISSPYSLYDAGGQSGGSAVWTGFQAADEAIQFDQVVNLSGGVMNPLIRMSLNGQTGYGAFINWSTPKIDFVVINAGGVIATIASPAIPSYANGAQVTVKMEAQGLNLRFKSWLTGTTEPTSWTATTTNPTYAAAGYGGFSNGGGSVDNVYFGPAETTFSGGFVPPVLSNGTVTSNSVPLNWTGATQSAGSTTYQVLRSPHGANTFTAISGVISPVIDGTVAASTSYDYKVLASDGINRPVSSNVLTLAIPAVPAATSFTLTGPPSGIVGVTTTAFTVTPNGHYTGTIAVTPLGSGLSTPIVLTFAGSASPQTFTVKPLSAGTVALTPSNNGGLANPSATSYLASTTATFYTLTGPSSGTLGVRSSLFTVAPNGPYTGTITVTPAGSGLATPLVFTFASSSSSQTFAITPTSTGTVTLTATNSGSLPNAGVLSYVSTSAIPFVAGSGQSIGLTFVDSSGNPSNLASLQSYNDLQLLTIDGLPVGETFTLSFNGQTTTPIPVTLGMPATYALWTIPVTPGTTYEFAVDTQGDSQDYSAIRVDFLDGEAFIGTSEFSEASGASNYNVTQGTWTGNMVNLATVTPAGSSLQVLFTCNPGGTNSRVFLDCLSMTNVATSAVTFYGVDDPTFSQSGMQRAGPYSSLYGAGYYYKSYGPFSIGGPVASLSVSAIRSALQALSSIAAGGLTVTDSSGSGVGPYPIAFGGPMGNLPQSLITTSDPTVTIAHTIVGGGYPAITINGGPAIPCETILWGANAPPHAPYALIVLPQSAPNVSYFSIDQGLSYSSGNWNEASAPGYSGRAIVSGNTGDNAVFYLEGFPPGTYQISATWVTDSSLATNAGYVIQDYPSTTTIGSATINQSVASADFTDQGYGWKVITSVTTTSPSVGMIVILNNPGGQVAMDAIRIARTSTDLSIQINPGDVVTLAISPGWATTGAGVVPGFGGMVVTNNCGTSNDLVPFVNDPKTMPIGYNVFPDFIFAPAFTYSNLAQRIQLPITGVVASDVNGYPTLLAAAATPNQAVCAVYGCPDQYGYGRGLYNAPNGYYTIIWDGASNVTFELVGDYTQAEVVQYRQITGTTGNRRVYNLQAIEGYAYSPNVFLTIGSTSGPDTNGHYPCNVSNMRIYPPNPSDPSGMTPWGITETPPKWHPTFLSKLRETGCLRFMDWLATNNCSVANFSDFRQPGTLPVASRSINIPLVSITNVTGTNFFDADHWVTLQITTAQPHGLTDGIFGGIIFPGTIECSDGNTYTGSLTGLFHAVSATVLQMPVNRNDQSVTARTMTNTITGGTLSLSMYSPGIFADITGLCNEVNADLWLNIPVAATDACVTAMAEYVAANLNPGLKVHVEYANECWNYAFYTWFWCRHLSNALVGTDIDAVPGQIHQSQHVQNLFLATMTSAGRGGDVVRALGTCGGNQGTTADMLIYAKNYSFQFEELTTSFYFDNVPASGNEAMFQPVYDLMTVGQSLDFYEEMVEWGETYAQKLSGHQSIFTTGGYPNVKLVCYEGGPDSMMPGNSTVNSFGRSHAMIRHPRMFACWARIFQKLQDAGCSLFNIYYLFGGGYIFGNSLPTDTPNEWSTYTGFNQQPGTGNWTTDAINISQPEAVDQIVSEVGGSVTLWNSLVPRIVSSPRLVLRQLRAIGSKMFRHHGV